MHSENERSFPDENLFHLKKIFSADEILLSSRHQVSKREIIVLVTNSGDIAVFYTKEENTYPIVKNISWYSDITKKIVALCFDPSGHWLLLCALDGTIYILPILKLVDPDIVTDLRFKTNDFTTIPSPLNNINKPNLTETHHASKPTAIVWWQNLIYSYTIGILSTDKGEIIFVNLITGCQVGFTNVKEPIVEMSLCQDNNSDNTFLLITCLEGQYKLVLEQRTTGYTWPIDSLELDANHDKSPTKCENDYPLARSHLPSTRTRLQGLKQLSVEKLASLRQKLAESRTKQSSHNKQDNTIEENSSLKSSPTLSLNECEHPSPEKLCTKIGETRLAKQYTHGKAVLTGFYASNSLLTVHDMNLEVVPLLVHKLPSECREVVLGDKLILVSNKNNKYLTLISTHLSETRLDCNMEYNQEATIFHIGLSKEEHILGLYRRNTISNFTEPHERRNKSRERSSMAEKPPFTLINDVREVNVPPPIVDTWHIITNKGIYILRPQRCIVSAFFELVLHHQLIERAERLAAAFGLELHRLLELAGDIKLASAQFPQAIALYKLARSRHLKSVLKFACCGHSGELLSYATLVLTTASVELSLSERIHLSNLAVMAHAEQVLRSSRPILQSNFITFLKENPFYDQVLAVNVAGQTGLWHVVSKLSRSRGLNPELLDTLTKILKTRLPPPTSIDAGLWECASEPGLLQPLFCRPQQAKVHLSFVKNWISLISPEVLERFAILYDISSPILRPYLGQSLRKRLLTTNSNNFDSYDSIDNTDDHISLINIEELIQTFLLVLIQLISQRTPFEKYIPELLKNPDLEVKRQENAPPIVSLRTTTISAGYSHCALIRDDQLYTWGSTSNGCLGTGPSMARFQGAQQVSTLSILRVKVLAVSCGRQHTLALTDNGLYSWGSSRFGQLGLGIEVQQTPWPNLVQALSSERVVCIAAGQYHSLVINDQGRVFTWGWAVHGQLGHGSIEDVYTPKLVQTLKHKVAVQVCGGHGHSLVLCADGSVFSFGSNVFGQLGNGGTAKSSLPIPVLLPEPASLVATGYFHNLAVTANNNIYIWGSSPQVLRLQAQAHKKARLLQQSQLNRERQEYEENMDFSEPMNSIAKKPLVLTMEESQLHLSPQLVDTSLVVGYITQIYCGCHHSILLTNESVLYSWGRNLDGQLGNGSRREILIPTPMSLSSISNSKPTSNGKQSGTSSSVSMGSLIPERFTSASCGGEYTLAFDNEKCWSWGSNANGQLGKPPNEEAKSLEGKLVMLKTTKRVIKLPHGSHNSSEVPHEVPGLPPLKLRCSSSNTYQRTTTHTPVWPRLRDLSSMDNPPFGPRALHYVLERFHRIYDSSLIMTKCIEVGNHQACALLSSLERNYHDALSHQLRALALSREEKRTAKAKENLEKSQIEKEPAQKAQLPPPNSTGVTTPDTLDEDCEIHPFSVQGGTEEMCKAQTPISENSIAQPQILCDNQSFDPNERVNNNEKQKDLSDRNDNKTPSFVRKSSLYKVQRPSSLELDSSHLSRNTNQSENKIRKDDGDLVKEASLIVEHYVALMELDGAAMLEKLLQQGLEFWIANSLPVTHLESLLLKNMSKYSYPLGLLLLNKTENAGSPILNNLSTKFCLQICSTLLSQIDQRKSYPEYVTLLAELTATPAPPLDEHILNGNHSNFDDRLLAAVVGNLAARGRNSSFTRPITLKSEIVPSTPSLTAFSCGHAYGQEDFRAAVGDLDEIALLPHTSRVLVDMFQRGQHSLQLACPKCVLGYLRSQVI